MQNNGIWVNSADGSGLVFAIKFSDGSLGLVRNKNGDLLQINFDDDSLKVPGTNIDIDFKAVEKEKEAITGEGA